MTAPTSDRARISRTGVPIEGFSLSDGRMYGWVSDDVLNTLITERLGGGERESVGWSTEDNDLRIRGWVRVLDALRDVCPTMDIDHRDAPTHDRPALAIRTLAQTAKDATARAETAEKELNEYARPEIKRLLQQDEEVWEALKMAVPDWSDTLSNVDLKSGHAATLAMIQRLRAQLDAMTGERREVSWAALDGWRATATWSGDRYIVTATKSGEAVVSEYATLGELMAEYSMSAEPSRAALNALATRPTEARDS